VLPATPGSLISHRLDQRPADLPSQLYVSAGRPAPCFSVVVCEADRPRLVRIDRPDDLICLCRLGVPIWLRISGMGGTRAIGDMLAAMEVPAALVPPLLEIPQRPRVDGFAEALLVVLHRLGFAHDPSHLISSQLGLLLLPDRLISIEEAPHGESFPALTQWLCSREGAVDHRDLDDILHFLIDDILDGLSPMLEQISHRLDDLEESALRDPKPSLLKSTFLQRSNLRRIRSQIWPLRHQIRVLLRQRQGLLGDEARTGFQEMGELVDLLFENCELLRHQCDAITHAYAATVGNRMNQVMKTLTILTSIFAPLTLIAGIYGMNFENMPELHWRYGYAFSLLLMLAVVSVQACWLGRRGWFDDWTTLR
jgi:magnesium transporter